ncbi:hypothetical protein [Ethanoligenens harbinense]|uniref:Uncharacterized protein n=1 Tax=Ethanoligenens harbinense (strain DSM 18485 / JCM 12961 / CGMCC 1.5033 / YUAN-3) TaxID=663278 RepID=E6U684_ETHHY|nr:hypothetical protein [Ethanoligenens harbinense]ADU26851.1 hypothetical protein Ethha_1311 [Ethanoligenens harbinense YUAN-3]AVQ95955.1 hypothetical protein CXQ68_06750 [Ethanoligenens harbinense YUAN-3]AYF38617.1 hypothetical protein CXP51_06620 [Ethanoligenens harbinense]AYF41363.1 hypothetical protein CN246_06755 [Ethanoligenens harbinense]QCN92196.1 hypothetical protein DRA42_06775 [Ethanoligenens harbinense]
MFFYQAIIILGVVLLLGLLVFVIRIKNRGLLAASVLLLSVAGAGAVLGVQNYFGSHIYVQNVDVSQLRRLTFSSKVRQSLDTVFADYTRTDADGLPTYRKTYDEKAGGVASTVTVTISVYPTKEEADRYFSMSQKFYDNRNFVPIDSSRSLKTDGVTHRYLTTFIKTQYGNYTDLIYLPSRMSSYSYVIVQDDNIMVTLSERAHKPVCTKNAVIKDLLGRLGM